MFSGTEQVSEYVSTTEFAKRINHRARKVRDWVAQWAEMQVDGIQTATTSRPPGKVYQLASDLHLRYLNGELPTVKER